ncbi:MAG: hypothetical protein AB7T38_15365 [Nitrospirales bacterium]
MTFQFAISIMLLSLAMYGAGCSHHPIDDTLKSLVPKHTVAIDPEGNPVDPITFSALSSDAFQGQLHTIVTEIAKSGKNKILVFVHGGLNHQKASLDRVKELLADTDLMNAYYPIFLNWNSDLVDTSIEDLLYIRQGRMARVWGPVSSPFKLVVAVGGGILRTPLVWAQMLSSDMNSTGLIRWPGKRNSEALAEVMLDLYRKKELGFIPIERGKSSISGWDTTAALTRYVVTLPSKLLLSPFIDGIGQGAWHNMLRRTQMLFHREEAFDIRDFLDDSPRIKKMLTKGPDGGAYLLFGVLRDLLNTHGQPMETTLIGHSMGTIVLNRVLQEFPDLPVRNIVYMAAACSIDDFRTSVIPYLQRKEHQDARFYNLMLHPDAEVREWQKSFLDLTPRGSLLVWIDNFLSNPQSTLDRTLGAWENIIQATHIIPPDVRSRIMLKAFCIGGENCNAPTTHGAFSDRAYQFWKPEFWQVSNGH